MIELRNITLKDKDAVLAVEAASMPKWRYLPFVFEMFLAEERGAFFLAERNGEVVACAKFTVLANNSAWLETLRVSKQHQGLGIGKQLYEHFFVLAKREGISTMRMYTGLNNAVSKGLAERFGFLLEETFYGFSLQHEAIAPVEPSHAFRPLSDTARATELLMSYKEQWTGFMVMNRTFYAVTPELCVYLAQQGLVYEDAASGSVVVMGARFMSEQALHLAMFAGNKKACLAFTKQRALELGVKQINCLFPVSASQTEHALKEQGFKADPAPYIVMKVQT